MKIQIDTSEQNTVKLKTEKGFYEIESVVNRSQRILPFIEEVLTKEGKTLSAVTAVEVITGPGSFTGLRVGVAIAQSLAWGLKIPLNGHDPEIVKSLQITYS